MNKEANPHESRPGLLRKLEERLSSDEIFYETEVQANRLGALILLCSGALLVLTMVLTAAGVFPLTLETIFLPSIPALIEIMILLIVAGAARFQAWWLKYVLMFGLVIIYSRLDSMLTHKAAILMVLPVVFSSRYFSRRLTVFTALLSTAAFAFSAVWGATHGMINLNIVTMPEGREIVATGGFLGEAVINSGVSSDMLIRNTLLYDYLPKWLMFSIASIISCNIARRGREMVVTQHEKDVQRARLESELDLASRIQAAMLPSEFPAFPDRTDFDIYAVMDPARDVGGDFYDFFLVDDDHLCLVIADVSGKGIPAALFMMAVRIILANNAKSGKSPARILRDANGVICANNPEEMFVSVWLGILELSTGKLTAANAGHEYPVLKRPDGVFELIRSRHGLVVGALSGCAYREYTLHIEPGTKLFVYTDGVPEASNSANEMFGLERMVSALNEDPDASPEALLRTVHRRADEFSAGAEQFDDLTMLCVHYKGPGADMAAHSPEEERI